MKRFHVHVAVKELQESIRFYSAMFGSDPTVVKPDYAKWMLEDPRLNFAISQRGHTPGINHLGVQAETEQELEGIHAKLQQAAPTVVAEKGAHCCYAKSDKYWITDPQGVAWESFRSLGTVPLYGEEHPVIPSACANGEATACCVPVSKAAATSKAATCCSSEVSAQT